MSRDDDKLEGASRDIAAGEPLDEGGCGLGPRIGGAVPVRLMIRFANPVS